VLIDGYTGFKDLMRAVRALEGRSMLDIQHYLGHRRIESTEIYTEHAPTNFRGWFK
jgi:site-specific recombinase XerD